MQALLNRTVPEPVDVSVIRTAEPEPDPARQNRMIRVWLLWLAFGLAYSGVEVPWWGNEVVGRGCEGEVECVRKVLGPGEYFGPAPGTYN